MFLLRSHNFPGESKAENKNEITFKELKTKRNQTQPSQWSLPEGREGREAVTGGRNGGTQERQLDPVWIPKWSGMAWDLPLPGAAAFPAGINEDPSKIPALLPAPFPSQPGHPLIIPRVNLQLIN